MTVRRIALGSVSGLFGLYMSKAGVDVKSAAETDMIFSPNKVFFQVIHERNLTLTQTYRGANLRVVRRIDHPDLGFLPLVSISCNNRSFNMAVTRQWNTVTNPVCRYPFGQTRTGFWLIWHTINTYTAAGIVNPGGNVEIRLFNIPTRTTGYALPAYDVLVPDS